MKIESISSADSQGGRVRQRSLREVREEMIRNRCRPPAAASSSSSEGDGRSGASRESARTELSISSRRNKVLALFGRRRGQGGRPFVGPDAESIHSAETVNPEDCFTVSGDGEKSEGGSMGMKVDAPRERDILDEIMETNGRSARGNIGSQIFDLIVARRCAHLSAERRAHMVKELLDAYCEMFKDRRDIDLVSPSLDRIREVMREANTDTGTRADVIEGLSSEWHKLHGVLGSLPLPKCDPAGMSIGVEKMYNTYAQLLRSSTALARILLECTKHSVNT